MSGVGGLRERVVAAVGSVCLAGLGACASAEVEALKPPPPLQPLESTTTVPAPDYAGVRLAEVGGRTRTTVVLAPGGARLGGTVVGPDGPVAGATVRVERLVGDAAASADVVSGPDGRWSLPGVLGGRYRVRAWRAPDMALLEPQVFFVEATEARHVSLVVTRFGDTSFASAVAPDPPSVGGPANLAFAVFRRVVDERGVVRSAPLVGLPAVIAGPGQWSVASPNPVVTNASGGAEWSLVCLAPGTQPLTVTVGGMDFPLTMPPCLPSPPPAPPAPGG
ncbi:MAG: carboxypeptidase-like regulatory domain-containing protein [Actinomycetota bacterium]|nr:carboxypeptidase-like regulatory domain-containing protein [Actinomycetota bacterium]